MSYCNTHYREYDTIDCPQCEVERRHNELLDQLRESDHERANPGEYECPHCRYVSLKRNASRCPLCHGIIDDRHWVALSAAEQRTRIRRLEAEAQNLRSGLAAPLVDQEGVALARASLASLTRRQERLEGGAFQWWPGLVLATAIVVVLILAFQRSGFFEVIGALLRFGVIAFLISLGLISIPMFYVMLTEDQRKKEADVLRRQIRLVELDSTLRTVNVIPHGDPRG